MFNFLKPRKPKVIWWSSIKNLEKSCPPVPSRHFIPKWFKEIKPSEYKDTSNIKLCPSFMQYFSTGWVIPLWCDIQVGKNSVGEMYCETPHSDFKFDFHPEFQFKDHLPEKEQDKIACVLKPVSPWKVKISKGWSLMQLPMTYHFEDDWFCLSGILPSSVWHETNQQLVIKKSFFKDIKKSDLKYDLGNIKRIIPKGTPLAQYVPVPDHYAGTVVPETKKLKELQDTASIMIGQKFTKKYTTMMRCPHVKK